MILCDLCFLALVSVHLEEETFLSIFIDWFWKAKSFPCQIPGLMGLLLGLQPSRAGTRFHGCYWVCSWMDGGRTVTRGILGCGFWWVLGQERHKGLPLNCSREQVKLGHRPASVTTVVSEVIRPIIGGFYGHRFCLVPLMGPWRVKVALDYGRVGLKLGHRTASRIAVRFEVGGPVTRGTYRHCFCHIPGMDP